MYKLVNLSSVKKGRSRKGNDSPRTKKGKPVIQDRIPAVQEAYLQHLRSKTVNDETAVLI